jgi:hypothetical protein
LLWSALWFTAFLIPEENVFDPLHLIFYGIAIIVAAMGRCALVRRFFLVEMDVHGDHLGRFGKVDVKTRVVGAERPHAVQFAFLGVADGFIADLSHHCLEISVPVIESEGHSS